MRVFSIKFRRSLASQVIQMSYFINLSLLLGCQTYSLFVLEFTETELEALSSKSNCVLADTFS